LDWKNRLYFGDNLDILRREVTDDSVDLIYLDPPFNSNATYNVLSKEKSGEESAAQIMAFEDTWQWGLESGAVYKEIVTCGPRKLVDLTGAMPGRLCGGTGAPLSPDIWGYGMRPTRLRAVSFHV
jgi:site-specific DNA-methyltransferase (adenine-specific)